MIGTTPGVIMVPKGAVFIRVSLTYCRSIRARILVYSLSEIKKVSQFHDTFPLNFFFMYS